MEINSDKTKVMIFNDPEKRKETDFFDAIDNHICIDETQLVAMEGWINQLIIRQC